MEESCIRAWPSLHTYLTLKENDMCQVVQASGREAHHLREAGGRDGHADHPRGNRHRQQGQAGPGHCARADCNICRSLPGGLIMF